MGITSPMGLLFNSVVMTAMNLVEMTDVNVAKMAAGVDLLPGVSLVDVVTQAHL